RDWSSDVCSSDLSYEHPGDNEPVDAGIHHQLVCHIEMTRGLVHEQNAWRSIERARQHDALLLPAAQAVTHVAHMGVVLHGHLHDLVVDACHSRAFDDALEIHVRIETRDVVRDGACE